MAFNEKAIRDLKKILNISFDYKEKWQEYKSKKYDKLSYFRIYKFNNFYKGFISL